MITQCPQCNTKFEISTELVESDDPRVRCGECLNVFNARVQLVNESLYGEPAIPMVTQKVKKPVQQVAASPSVTEFESAAEIDSYISPDDLENAATVLLDDTSTNVHTKSRQLPNTDSFYSPDLQLDFTSEKNKEPTTTTDPSEFKNTLVLDENSSVTSYDLQPAAHSTREPTIDTQAAIDSLDDSDHLSTERRQPVLPDDTRSRAVVGMTEAGETEWREHDSAQELRRHIHKRGGELSVESEINTDRVQHRSMILPLVCVTLAFAALLYLARDRISQLDLPESVLATFCSVTGCELPAKKDLDRLELLQHRTNIHAEMENVLVINVDIFNHAPFRQPYPVLAIRMADNAGATVAERKFAPADYLEPDMLEQTIPTGETVRIRFEILDPGPEAVTSELEFE